MWCLGIQRQATQSPLAASGRASSRYRKLVYLLLVRRPFGSSFVDCEFCVPHPLVSSVLFFRTPRSAMESIFTPTVRQAAQREQQAQLQREQHRQQQSLDRKWQDALFALNQRQQQLHQQRQDIFLNPGRVQKTATASTATTTTTIGGVDGNGNDKSGNGDGKIGNSNKHNQAPQHRQQRAAAECEQRKAQSAKRRRQK